MVGCRMGLEGASGHRLCLDGARFLSISIRSTLTILFIMNSSISWMRPAWPLPPGVRAAFSLRAGGASEAPFDGLNLGSHVGDAVAAVQRNRTLWAQQLGCRPVFLDQVHGVQLQPVVSDTPDGLPADAAWTAQRRVACSVLVADCLPVLLCDGDGGVVSAGHAGWRGLAGVDGVGVVEAQARVHRRGDVLAWLGPCIGPRVFEVGDEVRQAFERVLPQAAVCFQRGQAPGKWLADLAGLARQRLQALGIVQVFGNDSSPAWCTVSNPSRFFSYRRDGVCGRMAASIWRLD